MRTEGWGEGREGVQWGCRTAYRGYSRTSARTTCYGEAMGQDKPALGWDLEPLEPFLVYRAVTLRMNTGIDCIMAQMRRAMAARDPHRL